MREIYGCSITPVAFLGGEGCVLRADVHVQGWDDFTPSPLWFWKIFADGWLPLSKVPRRTFGGWLGLRERKMDSPFASFFHSQGSPWPTQMFPAPPITITTTDRIYGVLLTCLVPGPNLNPTVMLGMNEWMNEWIPDIVLKTCYTKCHFIFRKILQEWFYYYSHFMEKQAQRDVVQCLRPS